MSPTPPLAPKNSATWRGDLSTENARKAEKQSQKQPPASLTAQGKIWGGRGESVIPKGTCRPTSHPLPFFEGVESKNELPF